MGILDFWVILEILKIFDNFRGLKKKKKDILMVTTYFGHVGSLMSFFFFFHSLGISRIF